MHAILTLKLLEDRTNAARYVINVKCRTATADLMAHVSRLVSGKESDSNAQVLLHVDAIERVPIEEAPEQLKRKLAGAKELLKTGYWEDRQPIGEDNILVSFFFTSVRQDDEGNDQVDGGADGAISSACLLPEHAMRFMADNPKSTLRSAMLGDMEVDVDEDQLREFVFTMMRYFVNTDASVLCSGLNNLIRMDKTNQMRLRGVSNPSATNFLQY